MPPLRLMILDALAHGAETIYTMRSCSYFEPDGLALVGEAHILDELRSLLADGLVEVDSEYVIVDRRVVSQRPDQPGTSDDDLRRYWFRPTVAGTSVWEIGSSELDSYWGTHPSQRLGGR
jgi:hypothetical protein